MTEQPPQSKQWVPLSARDNPERAVAFGILRDDVPDWLALPLRIWIASQISGGGSYIERWWKNKLSSKLHRTMPDSIRSIPVGTLLDVIDCVIWEKAQRHRLIMDDRVELDDHLRDGGSLYRVGARGLERRVQPELQATADSVFASGSRAAQHLRDAWQRAWSRNPDASGAYQDGVQAVEAAYRPIVSPDNERATLGTIISNVRDKPTKFRVRLQPRDGSNVDRIVAMLEILWKSQRRHGTDDEAAPLNVSIEEAQDAVALATILVHLAQQGGFAAAR